MMKLTSHMMFVGLLLMSCGTDMEPADPCFYDLSSLNEEAIRVDTVMIFDADTYKETCFMTKYYNEAALGADSVIVDGNTVISLVQKNGCYQLLSIKTPGGCGAVENK